MEVSPPLLLRRLGNHDRQDVSVALVADRDRIAAARSAAGHGDQHEPRAQEPMQGRTEDGCDERVDSRGSAIDGHPRNVTFPTLRR